MKKLWTYILNTITNKYFLISICLFLCMALPNAIKSKIEPDQNDYVSYASRLLNGKPERKMNFNDCSCMPIMVFVMMPRIVEQLFDKNMHKSDGGVSDINHGRWMMLLLGIIILVLFYIFLNRNFSKEVANYGVLLLSISPAFITQTSIIKTDAFAMGSFLLVLFFFIEFNKKSTWLNFLFLSLSIAIAQHCKTFMLHLYILFIVWAIYFMIKNKLNWKMILNYFLIFTAIQIVIINAGFLFQGFLQSKNDIRFSTQIFQQIQQKNGLNYLLYLLPTPFLTGLDQIMYMDKFLVGHSNNAPYTFINYKYYYEGGKPIWYFFVTMFFKTPMLYFGGFLISLFYMLKNNDFKKFIFKIIALLGIYFLIYFNFLLNSRVAVHYTLFISILFYIILAYGISTYFSIKAKKIFFGLFIITFLWNGVYFYKNSIAYVNEILVFNAKKHFILTPTFFGVNPDKIEEKIMNQKFPMYKNPPDKYAKGKFFTTTFDVIMKYKDVKAPNWLINYTPEKIIDNQYLLYTIQ